jgi:hypothetical protein
MENDIMKVFDHINQIFTIISGGNIGIRTNIPQYPVDIVGTVPATNCIGTNPLF